MEINLQAIEKLDTLHLVNLINELIKNDFSQLVQLLYRIDVSEAKLKNVLHTHPNEDAAKIISSLIVERLAATKKARESLSNPLQIEDSEERL